MILAISGSLKRSSINSAALRAAVSVAARSGIAVTIDDSVRQLPHFDPDLEAAPPGAALRFRTACEAASGVLLAVPEYAFGIPGAFKNALDWTVGSGSLYRKPVALLNVAPTGRGAHAREALERVLTALDADFAHYSVPVTPSDRDPDGEIDNTKILDQLQTVVASLAHHAGLGRAA
jgi:NAD(P)H-dependent FMN reductase